MTRVLVVDDEQSMRQFLSILLRKMGFEVEARPDLSGARAALCEGEFDLVVTDLQMPGGSGIEVLEAVKKSSPDTEVIVITAFATPETAVAAMKQGAYDYITKPFKADHIKVTVLKALEKSSLSRENRELRRRLEAVEQGGEILGRSPKMEAVYQVLDRVAPTGVTVLVLGESGTGKELVARRLHALSGRAGPFVPVNCSAIPEGLVESELFGHIKGSFTGAFADQPGLFEQAQGGTLFLDEVGELPLPLQPKLLRAVQEGKIKRVGASQEVSVDVRIVSATNRDLRAEVEAGRFREDLYYRLNVVALQIPALRERREDIPLLAHHFLRKFREAFGREIQGISKGALELLENHEYPGNVRELENIIERAVALETGTMLSEGNLPSELHQVGRQLCTDLPPIGDDGLALEPLIESIERTYLTDALARTGGNKTEAARLLGLSFRSFRYRLDKLELS